MRRVNEKTKGDIHRAFYNLTGAGVPEEALARLLADNAIGYLELPESVLNDWLRPDKCPNSEVCDEPKAATLTGLAVGDALGMPFEMCGVDSAVLLGWKGEFRDGRASAYTQDLKAGQWTDDTKMARALAESLHRRGTYSPDDAAMMYLEWFKSGDLRGIGSTTRNAMGRLNAGLPWTQAGINGSEGNGSAMRAAPIGLAFWTNIMASIDMARIDARLTHKSEEAEWGSAAVAFSVAALLQNTDREALIFKVLEWLPDRLRITQKLKRAQALVDEERPLKEMAHILSDLGTGGHVVDTVPAAILAFSSTTNFSDAVRLAVMAGGDTDTTAAITGALAGTFYGIDQVVPFLSQVEDSLELRALEQSLFKATRPVYMVRAVPE